MPAGTKAQRRADLLAARRALPEAVRQAEAAALCEHARAVARAGETVCAYMPVGAEPGSPALVDRLRELCGRVLLPVTRTGAEPSALWWGEYGAEPLVAGRYGLLEPAPPWLPPETLAEASVIVVPALAVDRHGVRLGRGGGYYDRTLPLRRPDARVVAVVRDCEIVDELPDEPHDVRMTHALTPVSGLVELDPGN